VTTSWPFPLNFLSTLTLPPSAAVIAYHYRRSLAAVATAKAAFWVRVLAIVGRLSGGSQAEKIGRIAFTRDLRLGEGAVDERTRFIRREDSFAYHPKIGR
jgi:hypothetical protein